MSKNIPKFDRKIAPKWTPNPPKIDQKSIPGPPWAQKCAKDGPRAPPDPHFDDFGTIFDRFWDDFGPILGRFWTDFGTMLRRFWNDTKSFRPPIDHSTKEPDQPCTASPNPLFCFFVVVAVWLRFEIHNLELNPPTQNLELRSKFQDSEFKILNPLSPFWAGGIREAITIPLNFL